VATLVPYGGLRPGARYRVKVSRTVTDRAVNPLARIAMWSFTAAG
jgi:hypothetical protein